MKVCIYVSKRLLKENDSLSKCIRQIHEDFPGIPSKLLKTFWSWKRLSFWCYASGDLFDRG